MPTTLEKVAYGLKYNVASYVDVAMSLPTAAAKGVSKLVRKICGDKAPRLLTWEDIQERSPVYRTRSKLREKLDTEQGVKYLQSCLVGAIPFVLAGMPMAEAAQSFISEYGPDIGELGKCFATSVSTVLFQMAAGNSFFLINEVRNNKQKYTNENGRLSIKKIAKGFLRTAKNFLKFDIPYLMGKTALQTRFLMTGEDPWVASGVADSIAFPFFYALTIPLGLHSGLIETKQTREWKSEESIN